MGRGKQQNQEHGSAPKYNHTHEKLFFSPVNLESKKLFWGREARSQLRRCPGEDKEFNYVECDCGAHTEPVFIWILHQWMERFFFPAGHLLLACIRHHESTQVPLPE